MRWFSGQFVSDMYFKSWCEFSVLDTRPFNWSKVYTIIMWLLHKPTTHQIQCIRHRLVFVCSFSWICVCFFQKLVATLVFNHYVELVPLLTTQLSPCKMSIVIIVCCVSNLEITVNNLRGHFTVCASAIICHAYF